jgi:hypothetical protein
MYAGDTIMATTKYEKNGRITIDLSRGEYTVLRTAINEYKDMCREGIRRGENQATIDFPWIDNLDHDTDVDSQL